MSNAPITIRGNVTRDPEVKEMGTGALKATFSVAVENRYQKNGEWVSDTSFLNVTAWKHLAEDVQRVLEKGSRVIVTGRMSQRSYEDNDGNQRQYYEIVADDIGLGLFGVNSYERKTGRSASSGGTDQSSFSDDFGPEESPW